MTLLNLIKSNLGSISLITDEIGSVEQVNYFDPWGRERKIITAASIKQWLADNANFRIANKPITTRGFTGHEHLAEVGLIHMNGRIYAPKLARFAQADPIIQDPLRVQSLNRYSYVWNNPLNATDPSGFMKQGMMPSQMTDDPVEEKEPEKIEEVIVTGHIRWDDFSSFDKSEYISDSRYSVDWAGDDGSTDSKDWAGYQNIMVQATAGLLYSQAIINGGSVTWKGYQASLPVKSTIGGNIVVGGGSSGGILDGLGRLLSIAARGAGAIVVGSLSLTGSTPQDKNNQYRYLTYTRIHPLTKQVYSGRTSGYGTTDQILKRRMAGQPILNAEGFAAPVFDNEAISKWAIRGREQMLIDFHGGAQSVGGTSRNMINGISERNIFRESYIDAAILEFGYLPNNAPKN